MTAYEPSVARELLYAADEAEHLVFVPRLLAEAVLDARATLARSATWGDARMGLPAEYFEELVDNLLGPRDEPPADDETLDAQDLITSGNWPGLYYGEIEGWLPPEAVERFGEPWSGILDSGTHIPAEQEDEIIEFLRASGIACEQDDRVLDLFVD